MSDKTKKAQSHIQGTTVAQMIIDFHNHFDDVYPLHVMASSLCAVGPLHSMIGLAIENGYLTTMFDPHNRPDPATGQTYLSEQEMINLRDQAIKDQEMKYPSPLALWPVPWYLQLFGFPAWRFKTPSGEWHYLPNSEYKRLFGR